MLNLALAGEWEQLVTVERERDQQLRAYYAPERLESLPVKAKELVEWVMKQDQKIMNLSESAKREIAVHLNGRKQAKQMSNAYGAV